MKRIALIFSVVLLFCVAMPSASSAQEDRSAESITPVNDFVAWGLDLHERINAEFEKQIQSDTFAPQYQKIGESKEDYIKFFHDADEVFMLSINLCNEGKEKEAWEVYQRESMLELFVMYPPTDALCWEFYAGYLSSLIFRVYPEQEAAVLGKDLMLEQSAWYSFKKEHGLKVDEHIYIQAKLSTALAYSMCDMYEEALVICEQMIQYLEPLGKEYYHYWIAALVDRAHYTVCMGEDMILANKWASEALESCELLLTDETLSEPQIDRITKSQSKASYIKELTDKYVEEPPVAEAASAAPEPEMSEMATADASQDNKGLNYYRFNDWTEEDWADNDYYREVRTFLNKVLAGEPGVEEFEDAVAHKDLIDSAFVIFSSEMFIGGGLGLHIVFVDDPSKLFYVWVYSYVDFGPNEECQIVGYDLRAFDYLEDSPLEITREEILDIVAEHPEIKLW